MQSHRIISYFSNGFLKAAARGSAVAKAPQPLCYDLKLKLRLHLGKDLRKDKGCIKVVKYKDTG